MTLAPYRGFWDMRGEVDRLFNDMVGDLLSRRREGVARERRWELGLEGLWPPRGSSSGTGLRNRRFVGVPKPVKGSFVEGPPDELQPDRQAG